MCGLSTVVTPAGASLTMYREIRPYANSIWDDNNNNNSRPFHLVTACRACGVHIMSNSNAAYVDRVGLLVVELLLVIPVLLLCTISSVCTYPPPHTTPVLSYIYIPSSPSPRKISGSQVRTSSCPCVVDRLFAKKEERTQNKLINSLAPHTQ